MSKGIQYMVWVFRNNEPVLLQDALLPGIVPQRVLDLCLDTVVHQQMDLCRECEQACHCHVLVFDPENSRDGSESYNKLCPILFHDLVKPTSWQVKDLV